MKTCNTINDIITKLESDNNLDKIIHALTKSSNEAEYKFGPNKTFGRLSQLLPDIKNKMEALLGDTWAQEKLRHLLASHPFAQRLFCDSEHTQIIKKIIGIESPQTLLFIYLNSGEQTKQSIDLLLDFEALSIKDWQIIWKKMWESFIIW